MVLATASVGITASAAEVEDMPDTTNAVIEEVAMESDIDDTPVTEDKSENAASGENSDDDSSVSEDDTYEMEKYREIMNNLANAEGEEITADYENDPYLRY